MIMATSLLLVREVNSNESLQAKSLGEMITFIILATWAVAARFGARKLSKASVGLDDLVIVVGLVH